MEINDLKIYGSYIERIEIINSKILEMLKKKTLLYGGNKIVPTMKEQVVKTYYEGMNRKFERMPTLLKEYMETGSDEVLDCIIDTIADINGYSILSLVDISQHA